MTERPEHAEAVKTVMLAGRPMRITGDPADPYFGAIEAIAQAEAPMAAWAEANLPADAVMADIGGNIGLTALLLATLRPAGHVHVFEPMAQTLGYLRRNLALNGIGNCTAVHAALGDVAGSATLRGTGSATQVASVVPEGLGGVPVMTLDIYAERARLTRLDFVKLDAEGYEPAILEGAAATLERHRPPVLMEFNSWCLAHAHGYLPHAFAAAIWAAFEPCQLTPQGTAVPAGGGDLEQFLHDNMVLHGAVDDLLLRLRPGARVPQQEAARPRPSEADRARLERLERLERELAAMRASTSWRITAGLRAFRRALPFMRRG